jgi:DNA-binding winged helix-turn-helix (wHTH) protein
MASIHFDSFQFDPSSGELRRRGTRLPLQQQPARVLAYLIANADRDVTRDELIAHLWADGRHVQFDQGLNYCVRQIRVALGDHAKAPQFLATVGRTGYRWIGAPRPRHPRLGSFVTHPVPAWLAASAAAACLLIATVAAPLPPVQKRTPLDAAVDLRQAIHALHVLSHELVDPLLNHR